METKPAKPACIRQLKGFETPIMNKDGLDKLFLYIDRDMDTTVAFLDNFDKQAKESFYALQRYDGQAKALTKSIQANARLLARKHFDFCSFGERCNCKELCAYVHEIPYKTLVSAFQRLQNAVNSLICHADSINEETNVSRMLRHLTFLDSMVWEMLSRKQFGRDSRNSRNNHIRTKQ